MQARATWLGCQGGLHRSTPRSAARSAGRGGRQAPALVLPRRVRLLPRLLLPHAARRPASAPRKLQGGEGEHGSTVHGWPHSSFHSLLRPAMRWLASPAAGGCCLPRSPYLAAGRLVATAAPLLPPPEPGAGPGPLHSQRPSVSSCWGRVAPRRHARRAAIAVWCTAPPRI